MQTCSLVNYIESIGEVSGPLNESELEHLSICSDCKNTYLAKIAENNALKDFFVNTHLKDLLE